MRYTWITEKFLPIGEKLGQKGISAAWAESISAARFLPGGEKRANTAYVDTRNSVITSHQCRWLFGAVRSWRRRLGIVNIPETDERWQAWR